jgi:hypothetical protein
MIRETIYFKLRLGPDTNRFFAALKDVQRMMTELGVEPGRRWNNVTGDGRWVMIERDFDSLATYEEDDRNFHAGEDFMTKWREMETHAEQMRVELWQSPTPPSPAT